MQSTELSCVSLMNSEKLISEDSLCDLWIYKCLFYSFFFLSLEDL